MTDHMMIQVMECDPESPLNDPDYFRKRKETKMIKFMLLHAKSDTDEIIAASTELARACLSPRSRGKPFEIIPGRDQFAARFKACGSWDAWAIECGSGVDPVTRVPNFDGYLVPYDSSRVAQATLFVGAGTAKIVDSALSARRKVFIFRGDQKVAKVTRVRVVNPQNYQTGFALDHGDWQ